MTLDDIEDGPVIATLAATIAAGLVVERDVTEPGTADWLERERIARRQRIAAIAVDLAHRIVFETRRMGPVQRPRLTPTIEVRAAVPAE